VSTDTPDHGDAIQRMIAQGITAPDLATLTGKSAEDVKELLSLVKPVRGKQLRTAVYSLWDAMSVLCASGESGVTAEQLTDYITKMKPSQLPVALQSEFWSAQTKKLKYQEEVGDLWRTAQVQKVIAELLRIMRQSLTLMVDNVDQQATLTPRQKAIIQGIADSVLADARDRVREAFDGWDGTGDKEEPDPAKYVKPDGEVPEDG
jgi:hypothetical protein